MVWHYFSTMNGQVVLWGTAAFLFWVLSKFADMDSFEFVLLDALVLISALAGLLTAPFAFLLQSMIHTDSSMDVLLAGSGFSLLLSADALAQMKKFFLD